VEDDAWHGINDLIDPEGLSASLISLRLAGI
jgi:hypothetical protein